MDCFSNVADQFWPQTRNGLTLGSIYAMVALGYTMVYGVLQLINFAHSEVFLVGTVVSLYAFRDWFGVTEPQSGFFLILLLIGALIPAMLASGLTAIAVERMAYRPLRRRGAPRLSFLISAIGASLAIQYLFVLMDGQHALGPWTLPNILGPSPAVSPPVMEASTVFTLFGAPWSAKRVLLIVVAIVMLVTLDSFVRKTRMGKGIRAVAEDSEAAAMMGVNINAIITLTFFVGGVMAGAAGLLWIVNFENTQWNVGFLLGIKAFTAAVLGGIGNIRGAMVGGILLGLVEAYTVACFGPDWVDVTAFSVLVLILMFRPTGILGERVGGR